MIAAPALSAPGILPHLNVAEGGALRTLVTPAEVVDSSAAGHRTAARPFGTASEPSAMRVVALAARVPGRWELLSY